MSFRKLPYASRCRSILRKAHAIFLPLEMSYPFDPSLCLHCIYRDRVFGNVLSSIGGLEVGDTISFST